MQREVVKAFSWSLFCGSERLTSPAVGAGRRGFVSYSPTMAECLFGSREKSILATPGLLLSDRFGERIDHLDAGCPGGIHYFHDLAEGRLGVGPNGQADFGILRRAALQLLG